MPKKKSMLVSQYLEGISDNAIEQYQEFFRDFARRRHGVYALYRGSKLYYVGLATNLSARLKQHLKNRHQRKWDRFSIYLTIGDDHIRELEALVLRIVHPGGNRQIGKLAKAENLRPSFARRAREDSKRKLDALLGRETLKRKMATKKSGGGKIKTPVLAKYRNRPKRLRAKHKGQTLRASVRDDGSIYFARERFNSPSLAAHAAIGRTRAVNGWSFWWYERAPGDWVQLNELRR